MKRAILIFIWVVMLTGCNLFKKEDPNQNGNIPHGKEYTISGTMYDADCETPRAGKTLELKGVQDGGFQRRYDLLATTTTDSNGRFELVYKTNKKYDQGLFISQPSNVVPVYGPFLRDIPQGEDIERDICLLPQEYYLFKFTNIGSKLNDTIYVQSAMRPKIGIPYKSNVSSTYYIPLDSIKENEYLSHRIVISSQAEYGEVLRVYNYSMDRKKFDLVYNSDNPPTNWKEVVHNIEVECRTFPYVNEFVIDVSK